MTIEITLVGTGSPLPDPLRAGPATLIRAGGQNLLVDCGRGVLMRLAAEAGIEVVRACTLVMLSIGNYDLATDPANPQ